MDFLSTHCSLMALRSPQVQRGLDRFRCGDEDLDVFFREDALAYEQALFGKTYAFVGDETHGIASMFTVSNGSLQARWLRRALKDRLPYPKRIVHSYPSVLIGRLAVSRDLQNGGIGSEMLDFLKIWFADPHNKTGCRFLAVDAYNEPKVLEFYKRNGFSFIFKSEEEERASIQLRREEPLRTRMMCCDLFAYANELRA